MRFLAEVLEAQRVDQKFMPGFCFTRIFNEQYFFFIYLHGPPLLILHYGVSESIACSHESTRLRGLSGRRKSKFWCLKVSVSKGN